VVEIKNQAIFEEASSILVSLYGQDAVFREGQ
jgi:hypothetical protein